MNSITVSAKTVNDAITEASIQLGVVSSDIEYEVVTEGSAGFFGIGRKQAVIKAWKKVTFAEKTESVNKPQSNAKVVEVKKEVKVQPKVEKKVENTKEKSEKIQKPVKTEKTQKAEKPVKSHKENKKTEAPKKEVIVKQEAIVTEETAKEEKLVEVTEETKVACETFLRDVLKTMGMEVELTSSIDEEGALSIEMEGENMGILIGKRGQTLDSLQYLTNRVANKMQDGYVRVKLDTENYRQRRKDTLENLAKNIAHKVKRTKKAVSLEPMNPYERRIIHSALQGDRYVSTHSEGEEPYRRVVVTLNRKS